MNKILPKYLDRTDSKSKSKSKVALFFALVSVLSACNETKPLPAIGTHIDRPIDLAASSGGQFFYALNSSGRGVYRDGSILVLTPEGEIVSSYSTPRMGRSLSSLDSELLVVFDREAKTDAKGIVHLYEAQDASLTLSMSWELEGCSPSQGIMAKSYAYFAVSCQNGDLYLGEKKTPRSASTLKKIRSLPGFSRTWVLHPQRDLLMGFVVDIGAPTFRDKVYDDNKTWNIELKAHVDGPNDVPDVLQETQRDRRILARGSEFQFVMIDLAKELQEDFPERKLEDVGHELRWLYFNLKNLDGSLDLSDLGPTKEGQYDKKYYRTNIFQAKPDPSGADCFYLSHRGKNDDDKLKHANNIVKACFNGTDPKPSEQNERLVAPLTNSYLTFERVFGFKDLPDSQQNSNNYLAAFDFFKVDDRYSLAVNSVRDFVYFKKERYTLAVADLAYSENNWSELFEPSTSSDKSYYGVATLPGSAANKAYMISSSYYRDSLLFFEVESGGAPKLIKTLQ